MLMHARRCPDEACDSQETWQIHPIMILGKKSVSWSDKMTNLNHTSARDTTYNHRQNCWDNLHKDVYIRPPLPLCNVKSPIFVHSLLVDPNIAWWGRGRYGMLEDSVDFMLKKARFQQFKIYDSTVKLIQHFCLSVPTTFDEHCSFTRQCRDR